MREDLLESECEALVDEVLSMARPIQIKERLKEFYDYRDRQFIGLKIARWSVIRPEIWM